MRRHAVGIALLALGVSGPALAQGARIHMHADDATAADGMLFEPAGAAPYRAVLVIPDRRGLTRELTETAQALAHAGFFTVTLDLSHGEPPGRTIPAASIRHDLDAALAYLGKQTTLSPGRVGALGFGTGADYALELAATGRVRAVALENPTLPADAAHAATVRVPVLADLATGAGCAKAPAVHAFRGSLHHLGRKADVRVWENECAFTDADDSAHFKAEDAATLRERQVGFFRQTLAR